MSAPARLADWTGPARRRGQWHDALVLAPAVLVLAALAARLGGPAAGIGALATGAALALWAIHRRGRAFGEAWLVRRLDALRPELEDSAALLFADPAGLNPLQRLQQARIGERLAAGDPRALAPPLRRAPLLWLWAGALALAATLLAWPHTGPRAVILAPAAENLPAVPGVPRLTGQNLRVIPPAYTGLPIRDEARLDARVPAGSRLEWTLRFSPDPRAPRLAALGGSPLTLARQGQDWVGAREAGASFLYRVETADPRAPRAPLAPLHRIDVIADTPPQVRVLRPSASLTMVTPGQRSWAPLFEAVDDYGVDPRARLRVTLAIGEGENVRFSEREIAVGGIGPARQRRFAPVLDFARLGFAAGGDLVVQLIVRDTRSPGPQEMRGPSLVLRWPAPKGPEGGGLQGMVNTTLPAYFRSQRQIIIDAEALLRQKRGLTAERYLARSGMIGSDQEILRGRYSQFLGGEQEGAPEPPPVAGEAGSAGHDDDHAAGPPKPAQPGFGAPEDVLAAFGHPHDDPAAASLDPATRAILKNAVDEMWQSALQLNQGRPDLALPYANRALRFIKQVQQATRIFLSRVGPELPPFDPSRRMTGKREGLASRVLPVVPLESGDGVVAATWRALGETSIGVSGGTSGGARGEASRGGGEAGAARGPVDLGGLERWLAANRDRLADPLSLAAAIDAVRADPACRPCRAALRAQLWLALDRPPAGLAPRARGDAAGQRYLRLLGRGGR